MISSEKERMHILRVWWKDFLGRGRGGFTAGCSWDQWSKSAEGVKNQIAYVMLAKEDRKDAR